MARNKKVEILSHDGQVLHPITDGDCVIFPDGETLTHKLSEQEEVMYTPEVVNSSPMFKVGEGDSSDYSANVLDGAYQEAVLKGQTYVNTIQEPSADVITLPTPFTEYERTQSKTFTEMQDGTFGLNLVGQSYVNCIQEPSEPSYVALGENLEFQNKKVGYTTDGQIKSAMLNGMTLVNLWNRNNSGQYNITPSNSIEQRGNCFKKSTKYLLKYNILQSNTNNSLVVQYYQDGQWLVNEPIHADINKDYYILNTPSVDFNKIRLYYHSSFGTETVILKDIMLLEYQEGMENWDIPYFQGMQSVTMATELENVCSRYNSSGAKNGKTFTVGTWENRGLTLSTTDNISKYNFKPNTKYLVQFKVTNLNLDGLSSISIAFSDGEISTGNSLFGDNAVVEVKSNGIYRGILTTSNVISTSNFVIKGLKNQWENSTSTTRKLTISQVMCIEYQNGMENWDLPYFETTQLMKPLKVQSVNKNLFDGVWNETSSSGVKETTNYFRVTQGKTYRVSSQGIINGSTCKFYDKNKKVVKSIDGVTIQAPAEAYYAKWFLNTTDFNSVQMEESSTETPYTPHQEKTTSVLEPITLRAIGNVKDTLDLSTGEYVQRIGEIVLDGDEDWISSTATDSDGFATYQICMDTEIYWVSGINQDSILKSDKLPTTSFTNGSKVGIFFDGWGLYARLQTPSTKADFIAYLKSNPIKVQYVLKKPIVHKVNLSRPNLQTYTDITHVQSIAMDGTLIPKIFLPSDISYKAMLKPNTSYNVIIDREVIDSTNQLTVNLGGTTANITANRTVVRTPSTLSNETLTFSGKGNRIGKVMLIEGSTLINGDLPHFDGIGDVKLGRVVENLCMSNESFAGSATVTTTLYTDRIELKVTKAGSSVECFRLTKPLKNDKKYFIYSPSSSSLGNEYVFYGFKQDYNGSLNFAKQTTNFVNGKYSIITPRQEGNEYTHITIGNHGNQSVGTTYSIRRPIICEYINGMENWDWESIGYFTGTRNIGNEFMRIGNKNLFDWNSFKEKIKNESCFTILDNGFKADSSKGSVGNFLRDKYKFAEGIFKENTQYTISFDTTHEGNLYLSPFVAYTDGTYEGITIGGNGKRTLTTAINKTVKLFSVTWSTQANGGKSTLTNIQIEEASSATSYVAHKHNSLHILPNEQIPLTFEQGRIDYTNNGTWANAINNTSTQVIRTQLLDLEPNETYRVSCGHSDFMFAVGLYNNSLLGSSVISYTSDRERYITTTKDVHKIGIATMRKDSTNITPSVLHQVRLEKITDVTLRSVGNVKDELDLTRGVYIQRIGEIVLNGLEQWKLCTSAYQPTDTNYLNYDLDVNRIKTSVPILCDTIKTRDWTIPSTEINSRSISAHSTNKFLRLCIEKTIAPDVESLKTYLSTNMVKVQYQLTTPIEHKINIPMKNELNQTIAKPNGIFTLPLMYSETNHVDINSQIYPKVQSRDYISYPVIANNSQLHTVFHNKVGTGNLTVNLCGTSVTSVDGASKCTITTPSTISQYELRLSGAGNKVSNVCVFSGDYMNINVPYVQGMMNAVNPIVKNVGKNLFVTNRAFTDKNVIGTKCSLKDNVFTVTGTAVRSGGRLELYNYKEYISFFFEKGKKYSLTIDYTSKNNNIIVPCLSWGDDGTVALYISNPKTNPNATITAQKSGLVYFGYNVSDGDTYDCQFRIQLEEASTSSQYEEYKENNCKPDYGQIKLTKDMFEQGSFNELSSVKNYYETKTATSHSLQLKRIRLIDPIPVKPNTKYIVKFNGLEDYDIFVAYFKNNERVGFEGYWKNKEFTTPSDCNQIVFVLKRKGDAQILVDDIDYSKLIFSKVSEIIHLRSLPNGVRDELNLQTGEYIQRIGEMTLNDNDYIIDYFLAESTNEYSLFAFVKNDIKNAINEYDKTQALCDKLPYEQIWNNKEKEGFFISNDRHRVFIRISNDKLSGQSVDALNEYLSSNPIKVQYQLETPIIKQVGIHNYPHSYKDGHVIIESSDTTTNVTAQMTYQCVANRTGQIQEHTEQIEKQEHEINELEMLILENIRQQQNRSQNFLTSLISTLEIEEE